MKKEYINPELQIYDINQDAILINVSTGEGNPSIEVDDEGGDVNDALSKGTIWDE